MYDYADYNEKILGNISIIAVSSYHKHNDDVFDRFYNRFTMVFHTSPQDLEKQIKGADLLYRIAYGEIYGHGDDVKYAFKTVKTAIHCVFSMAAPHGDVYAGVSEVIAKKYGKTLYVPHMISIHKHNPGGDYRKFFRIPESATVFGRYGGRHTLDINILKKAITEVVEERNDYYFIFVNTDRFVTHERVIYIDNITDVETKNRFINTCDAMVHGRIMGESFGLAIGEFSVNNKPIITYSGPMRDNNHLTILKDNGIYFSTLKECKTVLLSFDKELYKKSYDSLLMEVRRADRLGLELIVMHPGAHVGSGEQAGLKRIAKAIRKLVDATPEMGVKILVETTAGQGSNVGYRFEHLAQIISDVGAPERIGVCFDTCHTFAAGYDIKDPAGYRRTMEEFDRIIGLDKLMAFHLNDAKSDLGSHVDRHEHIGKGKLGTAVFREIMRDKRFALTPKLLETPKGESKGKPWDVINLQTLRRLASR